MFTGIITDIGHVRSLEQRGDTRLTITTTYDLLKVDIGASIACSGVCLTVVDKGADWFAVDVSAETMACTSLRTWAVGQAINLERALKVGDELGGHIVTGHIDAIGTIESITEQGGSKQLVFVAPKSLAAFLAVKGSITADGVSLTVNKVEDRAEGVVFSVNVIPHTQAVTTFGQSHIGQEVNLEVDVLARYVSRLREVASC